MTDVDRRTAALLSLLAPFTAVTAQAQTAEPPRKLSKPRDLSQRDGVAWWGEEEIGMLVYPGMTIMDLIGPHCMFGSMMGAKIHLVAKSLEPVISQSKVMVLPTATFETCPRDLDVLFTPGGNEGTLAAAADPELLAFMADRGSRAKYVTSVCSGSLILGAAGLLHGYKATSHWSVRDVLAAYGAIPTEARVVRDRNRITGAGVTAGLDFGLTMVAEMRDPIYAQCSQLMSEYDPDPPFNSGSLRTAPEEVKAPMLKLISGFQKKAQELAAAYSPQTNKVE